MPWTLNPRPLTLNPKSLKCAVDAAVAGAIASKFRNAGQTCVCANRFLVQRPAVEEFSKKFAEAVSGLKVGHGLDSGVTCGPLINAAAVSKVEAQVADCVGKGARIEVGGQKGDGNFFEPTVLVGGTKDMAPFTDETVIPLCIDSLAASTRHCISRMLSWLLPFLASG